jgi:hypothetical protein
MDGFFTLFGEREVLIGDLIAASFSDLRYASDQQSNGQFAPSQERADTAERFAQSRVFNRRHGCAGLLASKGHQPRERLFYSGRK